MSKWLTAVGLVFLPLGAFFFWGVIQGMSLSGLAGMFLSALVIVQSIVLILLGGLAGEEGQNERRTSTKVLFLIALVIVAAVLPAFLVKPLGVNVPNARGRFERSIVRNASNNEEWTALTLAETVDYSEIFKETRFEGRTDYQYYAWANFVDFQVVEYYDDRFDARARNNLRGEAEAIEFRYEANVSTWNQIRIECRASAIEIRSLDGTALYETKEFYPSIGVKFAFRNDTKYQGVSAGELNFTMPMGYIVEMSFYYKEYYAPLAAFYSLVHQIVVLNQTFTPILLGGARMQAIS